jgi:hypothetical protein
VGEKRIMDIAREVVAAVHPEELGHFDRTAQAYAAGAVVYPVRSAEHSAASGLRTVACFSALVLDVTASACRSLGAGNAPVVPKRGLIARFRCRRTDIGPATVLPPITDDKAAEIEVTACAAAVVRGASGDDASALAKALTDRWTRV